MFSPADLHPNRPWKRFLTGWHCACAAGHSLTPGQYLVLCDICEHPSDIISTRTRSRRLHLSHVAVSMAQQHLAALDLITLIPAPSPIPHLHRNYPSFSSTPTPAAFKLFGMKGPAQFANKRHPIHDDTPPNRQNPAQEPALER